MGHPLLALVMAQAVLGLRTPPLLISPDKLLDCATGEGFFAASTTRATRVGTALTFLRICRASEGRPLASPPRVPGALPARLSNRPVVPVLRRGRHGASIGNTPGREACNRPAVPFGVRGRLKRPVSASAIQFARCGTAASPVRAVPESPASSPTLPALGLPWSTGPPSWAGLAQPRCECSWCSVRFLTLRNSGGDEGALRRVAGPNRGGS